MRNAETGPPGYRRRFSRTAWFVALQLDVTRAEKAVFDQFYDETTSGAHVPFMMPDYTTQGRSLFDETGTSIFEIADTPILLAAECLCLFGREPPEVTHYGVRFRIDFSVVVLP